MEKLLENDIKKIFTIRKMKEKKSCEKICVLYSIAQESANIWIVEMKFFSLFLSNFDGKLSPYVLEDCKGEKF